MSPVVIALPILRPIDVGDGSRAMAAAQQCCQDRALLGRTQIHGRAIHAL